MSEEKVMMREKKRVGDLLKKAKEVGLEIGWYEKEMWERAVEVDEMNEKWGDDDWETETRRRKLDVMVVWECRRVANEMGV